MKLYKVTRYEERPMIRLRGQWLSDVLGLGIGDWLAVEMREGGIFLREPTDDEVLTHETVQAERDAKVASDRVRELRARQFAALVVADDIE